MPQAEERCPTTARERGRLPEEPTPSDLPVHQGTTVVLFRPLTR